jgi:hypothetical protein
MFFSSGEDISKDALDALDSTLFYFSGEKQTFSDFLASIFFAYFLSSPLVILTFGKCFPF